ncbi:unnamed protein product [Closterium sp. NIES-54]
MLLGPYPRLLPPRERNTWWQHGPIAEMRHFSPRHEGFTPTRRRSRMAACLYASWRLGHPEQTQPTLGTCERTGEAVVAASVGSSSGTRDAGGGVSGGFDGDPLGEDAVRWREGVRSLALGRIGDADAAS